MDYHESYEPPVEYDLEPSDPPHPAVSFAKRASWILITLLVVLSLILSLLMPIFSIHREPRRDPRNDVQASLVSPFTVQEM